MRVNTPPDAGVGRRRLPLPDRLADRPVEPMLVDLGEILDYTPGTRALSTT